MLAAGGELDWIKLPAYATRVTGGISQGRSGPAGFGDADLGGLRGRIIAITSTVAHHIDVGGRVPGSESATALELYEEGLIIPPLKLFDRGKPNETFFRIFARNVRDPKASTGDINAQVAACRTGSNLSARKTRSGSMTIPKERMSDRSAARWKHSPRR